MKDKIIIVKIGNGYSLTILPEKSNEESSVPAYPQAQSTDLGTEKQKRKTEIGAKNVYESGFKSNKASHNQIWQKIHAA